MTGVDLRLAVPAAAAWIGLVLVLPVPGVLWPVAAASWVVSALLVIGGIVAVRRPRRGRGLVGVLATAAAVLAAVALVTTSAASRADARRPPWLVSAASHGTRIDAAVVTTQTVVPGDENFAATLTAVGATAVRVPVRVFDASPAHRVGIGTTIAVTVKAKPTAPEDGTAFLLFADGPPSVRAPPPWYLDWANGLRDAFSAAAGELPGDGGRLLPGLAIGDTTAVSDSLDADMKTSSLSHLTAVSGANCAVVIGVILAAGAMAGLGRKARIVASVCVLVLFVVLVSPEPSVMRAAVMATLVLVAMASGRPVRGLPVVALAVLVMLVTDPWLARNYGFALSVLATAGLLVLAAPLTRVLSGWLPRWLAAVIAVPLAAQLACQPVLILLAPSLPVYGIVANVLAAPAAPIATVAGLIACLLVPVVPVIGVLVARLAWLPSAWIAAVADFFSGLPVARIPWPVGVPGALLLAIATAFGLVLVLAPVRRWLRQAGVALFVVVGVVVAAAAVGSHIAQRSGWLDDWQIAACDIGQGDAMVVRSAGQVALMDTGPDPAPLTACLRTLGIDHIDLLVLSHFDLDHVGGVSAVYSKVTHAFVGPVAGAADQDIVNALSASGAIVEQVSRGPEGMLGDLRWRLLWPPATLGDIEPGNAASVTIMFEPAGECAGGCLSSLFPGDLGEDAQNRMLAANPGPLTVDVIEVAHHGSSDQSDRFYARVAATVGLIGVGVDNGYGHPTSRLLEILASVKTGVERTDLDGLVLVAPGGADGSVRVWTQRSGVAPGG
ncbi:ComEC/Rec2 family competence protein [Glaciihabitans sp. dw_435]|uniref:ComEC/Rec2 family competence protein n=1 Tax=Glaciihabitans sp. dw_435 TaxID=2720081 RepID=UPI001BD30CFC|nr:ComEC/Rec2 family competence protein [Glaciihabitans sp. dw_435]